MKILELILALLLRLFGSLEQRRKDVEQEQHENNVEYIKKDPVNWLDNHFNGVHDNYMPDNATSTDKAESKKRDG